MTIKPTVPSAWPGLMPVSEPELTAVWQAQHDMVNAISDAHGEAIIEDRQRTPASLLAPNWQYTPANKTDVQRTWRAHGWKPKGE